uniref:Reverse transcriptase domain-containing protein n=1 Tax=Lactuca sativa TaxID=4236 RepID=A0A9R1WGX4_LACSA|nr:hypothetical protein LSAT_V11C200100940 [Lactuca sativa]
MLSQKHRRYNRNKAINEEVAKLADVDILREAIFPTWIVNHVLVKKHDGSWRMCIDYSDLNNAYPKDHYPHPEIDKRLSPWKASNSNASSMLIRAITKSKYTGKTRTIRHSTPIVARSAT